MAQKCTKSGGGFAPNSDILIVTKINSPFKLGLELQAITPGPGKEKHKDPDFKSNTVCKRKLTSQ